MRTDEDIENYVMKLDVPYEKVEDGTWIIHDDIDNVDNLVVVHDPPIVVFRVKVMEVPEKNQLELFRHLLELNASELAHGAYGLEGNNIVLTDTLESENLDFNEFQASVESMILSLSNHYKILSKYR